MSHRITLFLNSLLIATACLSHVFPRDWTRFTHANSPLPADQVYALSFARNGTLWIGTGSGLAALRHGQWTVYDTASSPLPDPYVTAVAVEPGGTIWVGTGYAGIARISDGEWTLFDSSAQGLTDRSIFAITIGPDGSPWCATNNGVIHRAGEMWVNLKDSMLESRSRSVAFDKAGVLWMGTYDPTDFRGYLEFRDRGVFTFDILWKHDIFSTYPTAIAALNDSTVYIGTGGGLVRVVRGVWTVYRSQNSPLPASGIASLAVVGDTVIVGTASGVAEIVNDVWSIIPPSVNGLPNDVVRAIAVDSTGRRWLGMGGSGIVSYRREEVVTTVRHQSLRRKPVQSMSVYPNPFNPGTTIRFTIERSGPVSLSVHDIMGRETMMLMNEQCDAGTSHERTFDASHLPAGIYFARLRSGQHVQVVKMMLMK